VPTRRGHVCSGFEQVETLLKTRSQISVVEKPIRSPSRGQVGTGPAWTRRHLPVARTLPAAPAVGAGAVGGQRRPIKPS